MARTSADLPLRRGDLGAAVHDLQQRLRGAGFETGSAAHFDEETADAVTRFQESRGLYADGVVGSETWNALVESSYALGDRMLYIASPMLRGDDVTDLQLRLGALGIHQGRIDGMFGPETKRAVGEFQQDAGLVSDSVCGPETVAALRRLPSRAGTTPVIALREQESHRCAVPDLRGVRVVVGHLGGLAALSGAVTNLAQHAGATVLTYDGSDWSQVAQDANSAKAGLVIGLVLAETPPFEAAYFGTTDFVSPAGRHLAASVAAQLSAVLSDFAARPEPRRLPLLRETRAPAVLVRVGPGRVVVEFGPSIATAIIAGVTAWIGEPIG